MEPLHSHIHAEKRIDIQIIQRQSAQPLLVRAEQITPRGVVLHCTPDQVDAIHSIGEDQDQQPRYESMMLRIALSFCSGEMVEISSEAQIQSVRRVSQKNFEIKMCFRNMIQDGYRHISRYLVEGQQSQSA